MRSTETVTICSVHVAPQSVTSVVCDVGFRGVCSPDEELEKYADSKVSEVKDNTRMVGDEAVMWSAHADVGVVRYQQLKLKYAHKYRPIVLVYYFRNFERAE